MSNPAKTDWSKFWARQTTPCHALDDADFYRALAREMLFHTGPLAGRSVLELGCGNGAVSTLLGVEPDKYTGVDFSASLLAQFRARTNSLELVERDALGFLRSNTRKYDVILSFGMLQYLRHDELVELCHLQKRALNEGAQCAHFGIPARDLAGIFYSGLGAPRLLGQAHRRGLLKRVRSRLHNRIGHWHAVDALYRLSVVAGFDTEIVPNLSYFYRVNLLQRLPAKGRSDRP